uniref:Uncharacterized protein n=1 Tax=Hyaloperonospora arabidopsidis (strain Emoy2) TaxID=559515 RepID=M4B9Y7_HYAAE
MLPLLRATLPLVEPFCPDVTAKRTQRLADRQSHCAAGRQLEQRDSRTTAALGVKVVPSRITFGCRT